MTNIIEAVKEIIEKHTYMKEVNGNYEGDIYVDYRDSLNDEQINSIVNANDKMQAFYEELDEYVMDSTMHEEYELRMTIKMHWNEELHGDFYDVESDVIDWMNDHVYFNFDYDHFLATDMNVNIVVDTGDGDYDYTLNNFASYNASEGEDIESESSVLWLAMEQGYSKEDIKNALNGEYNNSGFLESLHEELINVTSHMNALAFFVKMTMQEYIDMTDNKRDIKLDKNVSCGLVDFWMGAGGMLNIALEKEVTLPLDIIDIHADGDRGYGVQSIFGLGSDFWTNSIVSV